MFRYRANYQVVLNNECIQSRQNITTEGQNNSGNFTLCAHKGSSIKQLNRQTNQQKGNCRIETNKNKNKKMLTAP